MSKFTIHIHHSGQYQRSVFDYEGWAHPRKAYWSVHNFQGTLQEARKKARELKASKVNIDYIVDALGIKWEV